MTLTDIIPGFVMESRPHQRVLPSNAPLLEASPAEQSQIETSSLPCDDFNNGHDCRICSCPHVWALCFQPDHGAFECPRVTDQAVLQNPATLPSTKFPYHCRLPQYGPGAAPFFQRQHHHTAQAAIKREHTKRAFHHGLGSGSQQLDRHTIERFTFEPIEWRSPKYVTYRKKQKPDKGRDKSGGIWTDRIEYAFQKALRLYGGRGRAKDTIYLHKKSADDCGAKLSGGNEWIAECIFIQTGEIIERKQVSSHIQVLKGKLDDNSEWLELVKYIPSDRRVRKKDVRGVVQETEQLLLKNDCLGLSPSSTLDLSYPGEVFSTSTQGLTIRSAFFGMYLIDKPQDIDGIPSKESSQAHLRSGLHHTYTTIQSETASAPRSFDDITEWQAAFPSFQPYDVDGNATPVFLFEAGMSLRDDHIRKSLIEIELSLDVRSGGRYQDWYTQTQYRDPRGVSEVRPTPIRTVTDSGDIARLRDVTLGAKYWSCLFSQCLELRMEVLGMKNLEVERRADKNMTTFFRLIKWMQQLWATPVNEAGQPRCVATILWKFDLVGRGKTGVTSWRQLVAPGLPVKTRSLQLNDMEMPLVPTATSQQCMNSLGSKVHQYFDDPDEYKTTFTSMEEQSFELLPPPPPLSRGSSPESIFQTDIGSSYPSSTSPSLRAFIPQIRPPIQFDGQDIFVQPLSTDAYTSFDSVSSQDTAWSFDSQDSELLSHDTALINAGEEGFNAGHNHHHVRGHTQRMYETFLELSEMGTQNAAQEIEDGTMIGIPHDLAGGDFQISFDDLPQNLGFHNDSSMNAAYMLQQLQSHGIESSSDITHPDPQTMIKERLDRLQRQHFDDLQQGRVTELSNYEGEIEKDKILEPTSDDLETQKPLSSPYYSPLTNSEGPLENSQVEEQEPRVKQEDDQNDEHAQYAASLSQSHEAADQEYYAYDMGQSKPDDPINEQRFKQFSTPHEELLHDAQLQETQALKHYDLVDEHNSISVQPLPHQQQQEKEMNENKHSNGVNEQQGQVSQGLKQDDHIDESQLIDFSSLDYHAPIFHSLDGQLEEYTSPYQDDVDVSAGQSPFVDDMQGWEHVEDFMRQDNGNTCDGPEDEAAH